MALDQSFLLVALNDTVALTCWWFKDGKISITKKMVLLQGTPPLISRKTPVVDTFNSMNNNGWWIESGNVSFG